MAPGFDQPGGGKQYQIDWERLAKENGISKEEILNYDDGRKIKWLVEHDDLYRLTIKEEVSQK